MLLFLLPLLVNYAFASDVDDYVRSFNQLRCENFLSAGPRVQPLGPPPPHPKFWNQFVFGDSESRWQFLREYVRERNYKTATYRHGVLKHGMGIERPLIRKKLRAVLFSITKDLLPDYKLAADALNERAETLLEDCRTPDELNEVFVGIRGYAEELRQSSLRAEEVRTIERRARELRFDLASIDNGKAIFKAFESLLPAGQSATQILPAIEADPGLKQFLIHEVQFLRRLSGSEAFDLRLANDLWLLRQANPDPNLIYNLRREVLILKSPWLFRGLPANVQMRALSLKEREHLIHLALRDEELRQNLRAASLVLKVPNNPVPRAPERAPPAQPENSIYNPLSEGDWEVYQDQLLNWQMAWTAYQAQVKQYRERIYPQLVKDYDQFAIAYAKRQEARRILSTMIAQIYPHAFAILETSETDLPGEIPSPTMPAMPAFEPRPPNPYELARPRKKRPLFGPSSLSTFPTQSGWH